MLDSTESPSLPTFADGSAATIPPALGIGTTLVMPQRPAIHPRPPAASPTAIPSSGGPLPSQILTPGR
jgi:hypothetical protein